MGMIATLTEPQTDESHPHFVSCSVLPLSFAFVSSLFQIDTNKSITQKRLKKVSEPVPSCLSRGSMNCFYDWPFRSWASAVGMADWMLILCKKKTAAFYYFMLVQAPLPAVQTMHDTNATKCALMLAHCKACTKWCFSSSPANAACFLGHSVGVMWFIDVAIIEVFRTMGCPGQLKFNDKGMDSFPCCVTRSHSLKWTWKQLQSCYYNTLDRQWETSMMATALLSSV